MRNHIKRSFQERNYRHGVISCLQGSGLLIAILFCVISLLLPWQSFGQFSDSARDVQWSPQGLRPENFRVVTPARKSAKLSVGAVTSSEPGVEVSVLQQDLRQVLKISMTNKFNYNKSWISAEAINDSALLAHEQGHFDLNEIYARKTFEQLRQFRFTPQFKSEIAQIMNAMSSELKKVQKNYEQQTIHGLMASNQAIWSRQIALALQQLPPYEGRQISQTLPEPSGSQDAPFQNQ